MSDWISAPGHNAHIIIIFYTCLETTHICDVYYNSSSSKEYALLTYAIYFCVLLTCQCAFLTCKQGWLFAS